MVDSVDKVKDEIAADMRAVEDAVVRGNKEATFARAKDAAPTGGRGVYEGSRKQAADLRAQNARAKLQAEASSTVKKQATAGGANLHSHNPSCKPGFCAPRKNAGTEAKVTDLTDPQAEVLYGVQQASQGDRLAYQKQIAEKAQKSISRVSRTLKELEVMRFVEQIPRTAPKAYKLTTKGTNAVEAVKVKFDVLRANTVSGVPAQAGPGDEGGPVDDGASAYTAGWEAVRAHNFRVKIPLTRAPGDDELVKSGWLLDTKMGWTRYTGPPVAGVTVHITPHALIVYLPEFYASAPDQCELQAAKLLRTVVDTFRELYPKAVLGTPTVLDKTSRLDAKLIQQHVALVGDVWATQLKKDKISIREERFEVDASKGKPELEFTHPATGMPDAQKYADMITRLIRGEPIDLETARQAAIQSYLLAQGAILNTKQIEEMRTLQRLTAEQVAQMAQTVTGMSQSTKFLADLRAMDLVEERAKDLQQVAQAAAASKEAPRAPVPTNDASFV